MTDRRKYADRREYLIKAVARRRKNLRGLAVKYKGGRCSICGYDKCAQALEFHHTNKSEKDFGVSEKGYTRSWGEIKNELEKCILVCANCHRELHVGLCSFPEKSGMKNEVNCGKSSS